MRKISILGSTGSIGTQTLAVIREHGDIGVRSLAALKNIDLLEDQIRAFRPDLVCVYEENAAKDLKMRVADLPVRVLSGMEGLVECASEPGSGLVVGAVVGMIGIRPVMDAIRAGKDIAIANKETLVTAGHLIMPLAKEKGVRLLPVDSEHSAIFQCLHGEEGNAVRRILLTASGGPFRGYTKEMLARVGPEDALKHPNWTMGAKITVDSSTLVNKGLEVMEAHWLFGCPYEKIEVVVQPQSVIHSMVEFEDGAVKAQLGTPDMRIPIQYALYHGLRPALSGPALDFGMISALTFEKPDTAVFEALPMAYEAGQKGGNAPTVFNAANEWAVRKFLERKLPWARITESIRMAMAAVPYTAAGDLPEILDAERAACEYLEGAGIAK